MRSRPSRTTDLSDSSSIGQPAGEVAVALSVMPPYDVVESGFPFGLLLVQACLADSGIPSRVVRALDSGVEIPGPIVRESLLSVLTARSSMERAAAMCKAADGERVFVDSIVNRFVRGRENVIGFSVWQSNVDFTLEIVRRVRLQRPDAIVILGGPQALQEPDELMVDQVDWVLVHSNPAAIVPLFQRALGLRPRIPLQGVWSHARHRRVGVSRPLDSARVLRPRIDYAAVLPLHQHDPVAKVSVLLNFGCPYACGFCCARSLYPTVSWGAPEVLAKEIVQITDVWSSSMGRQPPDLELHLADATANANPALLDELCRLILSCGLPRPPTLGAHFLMDQRITPRRVSMLMEAGFHMLSVGLESASVKVRREMRKPGSMSAIRRACETIAEVRGRRPWLSFFVIVGWPSETDQDFDDTAAFIAWVAGLGILRQITAIPLLKVPGQPMEWGEVTRADRGCAWEHGGPGGAPEVRFNRLARLRSRFGDLVEIPFPMEILGQAMCRFHVGN